MVLESEISDRQVAAGTDEPLQFVRNVLLAQPPFAFRADPGEFAQFCSEVAERLKVHPDAVTVIGSARLGFSLNKARLLSPFSPESDLDIVIVSSTVFDATWVELVVNQDRYTLAGGDERQKFKRTKENFFFGYLRPDNLPASCGLSKSWFPLLESRFASPVAQLHPVAAWLFKSWEHVQHFYSRHLSSVQSDIRRLVLARGERI